MYWYSYEKFYLDPLSINLNICTVSGFLNILLIVSGTMVEQNICLITYFLTFVNLLQEILGENNKKGLKKGKQRLALLC